jgi:hypothetical protein
MSDTQPNKLSDTQPRKFKWARSIFWIGLLSVFGALLLGAGSGYGIGNAMRLNAEKATVVQSLSEQLVLAQQDFDLGHYDNTRQRLEYIIKKDPNYPGAADLLTKVIVQMAITPTLTLTPTPTITPTPDLRNQDAIFAQAQQQLQNSDWSNLLASLDSLRKSDPTYKTAQVDSMYYTALRNRGVSQINGNTTNLEGGIYDLTLAERFGPLDGTADGLRTGARLYIIGASFWELDWAQASSYFAQVYQFYPNLRDSSNVTAGQRYHDALLKYGDQQASAAKLKDRCAALNSWDTASNISPLDNEYSNKYFSLNLECNPPTATIDPALLITPLVDTPPPAEEPTATPTP